MSGVKSFIIHLERSIARRPGVERLRAALPFESETFPAVEGSALSANEVDAVYARRLHRPRYSFTLNAAEIGVFLSHRAVWRRILDEGLDYAVVFEDDAEIDESAFAETCALLAETRSQWSYVLAPSQKTHVSGAILSRRGDVALIRPTIPPLRAIAQFVSAEAAKRLLAATERFDRPVDTLLQLSWVTGVELLAAAPSGVRDISAETGGSTIQAKSKDLRTRLHHELARPLYRAQLRLIHGCRARARAWGLLGQDEAR